LLTGVYFVAGLLLLAGIDAERGRQVALQDGHKAVAA
jgi:ABC-type glucose/galactose transport system permease subunit